MLQRIREEHQNRFTISQHHRGKKTKQMETSTIHPNTPTLGSEDEDALASQVLEIIGGITLEALKTLEEPDERDLWLMEEGDDSVFYSDEEQPHQDKKGNTLYDFDANKCKQRVNSVAAAEPNQQRDDDAGEEVISRKTNQRVIWTEEECQKVQTPKAEQMHVSDPRKLFTEPGLTPENSVRTCGEILQPTCTTADMQTQPDLNIPTETANLQVKEGGVVLKSQTPNLNPFEVFNESYTRLNGKAKVPKQLSGTECQTLGDRQPEVDREAKQDHSFNVLAGFHQKPSQGSFTLPLSKKPGSSATQQSPFNHLTSTKYSTVSYRRIRRGNTQQKIQAFEYMMTNK